MLYYDMETTGLEPDALPTVAVVRREDGSHEVFHSGFGNTMTPGTAGALLDLLLTGQVVTWNGAGFDFRILANALPSRKEEIAALASGPNHIDIMYHFWAEKGYPAAMASFAGGEKTATGGWAATAWFSGVAGAKQVIDYCIADTDALFRLYTKGTSTGLLSKATKSGGVSKWFIKGKQFKSVSQSSAAYYASPPDVSWFRGAPPDFGAVLAWV